MSHADDLIYEWEPVFGTDWDTETHKLSGDVSMKAHTVFRHLKTDTIPFGLADPTPFDKTENQDKDALLERLEQQQELLL